jgi:uncharacterized protein YndB with AHSA1/START domain
MAAKGKSDRETKADRASDRELVVTRTFDAPGRIVFKAWTTPELLLKWWAPKSFGLNFLACEVDARVGGRVCFTFGHASSDKPMEFFGKYLEVVPNARLVWTNEESEDGSVTTVTFEERGGVTLVTMRDLYPSKKALDEAIASGSTSGVGETFNQLDEVLGTLSSAV